jgi:hypothetical protein
MKSLICLHKVIRLQQWYSTGVTRTPGGTRRHLRGYVDYTICKVRQSTPSTRHRGAWGERRYSSYSFSTSALDGVSGQCHAPAALLAYRITCIMHQQLCGVQSWREIISGGTRTKKVEYHWSTAHCIFLRQRLMGDNYDYNSDELEEKERCQIRGNTFFP